ncbi:MAG TPA: hypothetical protein VJO53_13995 [Candidatus Acidoferrales bacterium]|nr:hypothetical protein [Candidatus Acidoferrales bacterium]
MRKVVGGLGLLTIFAISLLAAPLRADDGVIPKRTVVAPRYDVSKEVTVTGIVESLVTKPAAGAMLGAHLLVSTSTGTVDAHIGRFVASGPNAVSFSAGQAVKLVGVMTTINEKEVFLTRTIETGNRTITVRNERGFFVPSGVKGRLAQASVSGGAR